MCVQLEVHFDAAAAFASRIAAVPGLLGAGSFPDLDMLPIGYITNPGDDHKAPNHWSAQLRGLPSRSSWIRSATWCALSTSRALAYQR